MTRPSWDRYFLDIAQVVSSRSTCPRLAVGAVLVKDRQILSTGFNGSPPGHSHCEDVGCAPGPTGGCGRATHAEANAVCQAAKLGIALDGATAFLTCSPCAICSRLLLSSGITRIVYAKAYRITEHLNSLGIDVVSYEEAQNNK